MQNLWKILLVVSVLINLVAIWGFYHYVRYGGSPLGELKRRLTGTVKQAGPRLSYADENQRIIEEMGRGVIPANRVVFFGASITRRWNLPQHFPEFHMINRGVGGQLVPDMMTRFKRDVLDLRPDAVIIKFCSINIRPHLPLTRLQDAMAMMVQMTPPTTTIIPAAVAIPFVGKCLAPYLSATMNDSFSRSHWRSNASTSFCLVSFDTWAVRFSVVLANCSTVSVNVADSDRRTTN